MIENIEQYVNAITVLKHIKQLIKHLPDEADLLRPVLDHIESGVVGYIEQHSLGGDKLEELLHPTELRHLTQDEVRFYRLIEERETFEHVSELTLACGHRTKVIDFPANRNFTFCHDCFLSRANWRRFTYDATQV